MLVRFTLLVMVVVSTFTIISIPARAEAALNAGDLVEIAIEVNPQVRSLRAQWEAAQHQILQNYAPADPVFTYGNVDSSKDFNAALHIAMRSAKTSSFQEKRFYRRIKQSGAPRLRV